MKIVKIDDTSFAVKDDKGHSLAYSVDRLLRQKLMLTEEIERATKRLTITNDIIAAAREAGITIEE